MENQNLQIYKASAGSGKTFTLAVEYISLLAIQPNEYQHILAVTFTNKATAEMKQRILGTLYGITKELPSAEGYIEKILEKINKLKDYPAYQTPEYQTLLCNYDRKKLIANCSQALSAIIHDYSRFRIETIDSFFKGIVQEIANELELSTNLKVELDAKSVLSDSVDEIIDNLITNSPEYATITNIIDDKINSSTSGNWKVQDAIKEFGENIFKESFLIHGEEVRKTITDNSVLTQYEQKINDNLKAVGAKLLSLCQTFMSDYANGIYDNKSCTANIVTFMKKVEPALTTGSTFPSFSDTVKSYATDVNVWFKAKAPKRDAIEPAVASTWMPFLNDELFPAVSAFLSHTDNVKAIAKHLHHLLLLKKISETVKDLNDQNNRFLLAETANFLRNVINKENIPFIYEKTGTVIKHIMIDEFQDTSALQWQNFKPLILNSIASDGSCLIVGDVKQSIYRFRNSDWQILNNIEEDEDLKYNIGHIPAEYNFRSSENIVNFNNDFFEKMCHELTDTDTTEIDCSILKVAYGDVHQTPKKDNKLGYIRVENIDYHSIEELDTDNWDKSISYDIEEANLERLQACVKELIDNNVNANDITILVRKNKELPLVCEYFNEHQDVLPVKVVSDEAFRLDASPTVNIIIHALRALTSQKDQLPLATLAYYYQTLVHGNDRVKENISIAFLCENSEELNALLPKEFRSGNRNKYEYKSLSELIEDIYQIFELNRIKGQDAYMFCFNDVVEEYSNDNLTDLDSFLSAWDEKLCAKTIPNGESKGIRIMSMHKSKGLEFHTVIIPFCNWSLEPNRNTIMWCETEEQPYNDLPLLPIEVCNATKNSIFYDEKQDENLRTLVDNINLLYVGFTRPKNNLIIISGKAAGKKEKEDNKIKNAQGLLVTCLPSYMTTSDIEDIITVHETGAIVPSEKKDEKEDNILIAKPLPMDVVYTSHPSTAVFRQSHESDLFINADSADERVKAHTHRVSLIAKGNLYHNIFQNITTPDTIHRAVTQIKSKGCFENLADADEVEKQITTLISNREKDHPEWFSPDWKVINERAIIFTDDAQGVMNKRPDRVIVKGDRAIVIDYKTAVGVVSGAQEGFAPSINTLEENKGQVKLYAQLLTQLGFKQIESYLWYILDDEIVSVY